MLIDFVSIPMATIPNMKGGEKEFRVHTFTDAMCKIMRGTLIPGASIGLHTHESNYEVIYIVSGRGTMLCDGEKETLGPGDCTYCPQGHTHSLMNTGEEDLEFFAVLPNRQ